MEVASVSTAIKSIVSHLLRGVQDIACCSADGMAHRGLHSAHQSLRNPDKGSSAGVKILQSCLVVESLLHHC